jgi:hypothetical protein
MGVLGAPVYHGGAIRSIYKYLYLSHLSIEKVFDIGIIMVPNVLDIGSPHTCHPHTIF